MLRLAYKLWQLDVHCNENYSSKNQHNLWRQCTHNVCARAREPANIGRFSQVNSIATTKQHDDNEAGASMRPMRVQKNVKPSYIFSSEAAIITVIIVNRCVIVEMLEH